MEQGLTPRLMKLDEIFAASAMDQYRKRGEWRVAAEWRIGEAASLALFAIRYSLFACSRS